MQMRVWMKFPQEGSKYIPPHNSCDSKWKDYSKLQDAPLTKLITGTKGSYSELRAASG
jgi:1-phosphatidylinositol-4-phosphate 5-kinase